MRIKATLAALALVTSSAVSATAGNLEPYQETTEEMVIPVQNTGSPSLRPELIVPVVVCLLLCGSLGGGSGT
ncbi:hypothetical protein [Octadecabacter sp. R77987]|uniref:hypothetical protein n=1 Tax=Octadecabacter sp. R77987 TaxID=3093874 RepID=UPI00366F23E5